MKRLSVLLLIVGALQAGLLSFAAAEVRFGNNVRIGGHDASNQTFNKERRGRYYIYDKKPARSGCVWQRNADGSKTKVCHLQRKRTNNR